MINIIIKFLRRIIAGIFILYGYNMLASSLGFIIPINFITIFMVSILGIPGLLSLVFVLIFVF